MKPQRWHNYRSAVTVVPGVVDVLQPKRRINPAPQVQRVVSLSNVLAPVTEASVAQQKAMATEREVLLMIARDTIRNKSHAGAIEFSIPTLSAAAGANRRRLIHFRIGERLMPAFVPSPPAEHAHPAIERLLEIDAESILGRRLQGMRRDIRFGGPACQKIVDRFSVTSHVRVIQKTQEADDSFLMPNQRAMQFDLDIFRVRPAHVRIQMDSIR